jgi:hypothetical protein
MRLENHGPKSGLGMAEIRCYLPGQGGGGSVSLKACYARKSEIFSQAPTAANL